MLCEALSYNTFTAVRMHPADVAEPRSFHLALLLDTSGSMEGPRLEALQKTLHILVDHLKPTDRLTIIEYNTEANTLAEGVSDPACLHDIVNRLTARGGTCMESAILQLVTLVRSDGFPPLQGVFLMTDGYVNAGIRTLPGLTQLLQSLPPHVPVNTRGFGDHQAPLLQGLAVPSRGTYTYAEAGEMLPVIIGNIVAGLSEESATGVSVDIPEGMTCLEVGQPTAGKYLVGNLVANKTQWVVLSGSTNTVRITWNTNGVPQECEVPVRTAEGEDLLVAKEQWFRARAVRLFLEARASRSTLGDLSQFEGELDSSGLMDRPLMMRLKAQLFEVVESLKETPIPRFPESRTVSRLLSNLNTFGLQRGVLLAPESQVPDPVDHMNCFQSPTQRLMSQNMSEAYSQDPM